MFPSSFEMCILDIFPPIFAKKLQNQNFCQNAPSWNFFWNGVSAVINL